MSFGHYGPRPFGMRGGHYRGRRSRSRRRSGRYARPSQPPSTPSNPQSAAVARFLKSPQFTDALLGAVVGIPGGPAGMLRGAATGALRGGWRARRPPREEGEGHPGGWMSRGKRRGY